MGIPIHSKYIFSVSIVSLGTIDITFEEPDPDWTNYLVSLTGMVSSSQVKPAVVNYNYSDSTSSKISFRLRASNDLEADIRFMFSIL